jgi:hypothetical protein
MAVTDHGNFDLAIELTEELLSAALLAQLAVPTVPLQPTPLSALIVVPKLTVAVTSADCRSGTTATVAFLGTITGHLLATSSTLLNPLPTDPKDREIPIDARFTVIANPTIGTVSGTRGLTFPMSGAATQLTLAESAIIDTFLVRQLLIAAYVKGGESGYLQSRTQILTEVRGALVAGLQKAFAGLGNFVAVAEPSGVSFRVVLTTDFSLKLLITVVPPDGNATLASGLTVRRNSLGGPLDHCVFVISNAHLLGGVVFPALTTALGIPGAASRPEHPCLLLAPTLPTLTFGPRPPRGVPPPTLFVDRLLGQVDASGGVRLDLSLRAVSLGGFVKVTMGATVSLPFAPTISGGTLTIGFGPPVITTTTDVAIDPMLYVVAFFSGGLVAVAATAIIDGFGGGFMDSFIRDTVVPSLPTIPLPSISLSFGSFPPLTVNLVQTTEATAPARSITLSGLTIPLDRVNDVFIRML